MFGTKDVAPMGKSAYIRPGVNEVEFVGVSGEGTYLEFSMKLLGEENDNSTNFRLYMSSQSQQKFQESRIRTMGEVATKDDSITNVEASSIEEYGSKLNKFFAGKKVRMLFTGKEYLRQDGNIGVRCDIGVGNFVESIDTNPSKLNYDESRHMTKLEIEENKGSSDDSLPGFVEGMPDDDLSI